MDATSVNALLALAKYYQAKLSTADVPAAYLQVGLKETIYVRFSRKVSGSIVRSKPQLEDHLDTKGHLYAKLNKSLYDLKNNLELIGMSK